MYSVVKFTNNLMSKMSKYVLSMISTFHPTGTKLLHVTKTKKCQSAARDTPDLIQTECVPDSGLARQIKKNKQNVKERKIK